jgi:hypothetical protein
MGGISSWWAAMALTTLGGLAKLLGQLGPDQGMGPLHFMVDGLANIVKEPHSARQFLLQPQFRSHHRRQEANLDGVLKNVLRIACPEI